MIISKINLINFRNYENLSLNLSDKINIFIGNNGQGKTNLLEAIYFITTTRSFRSIKDEVMIKHNEKVTKISLEIINQNTQILSSVVYPNGKTFFIGNNIINKTSEFIGEASVVLFTPQDLQLIYGSPKTRRYFLDMELGKISKLYLSDLKSYYKILKERNEYLKENNIDFVYLSTITEKLIYYGTKILEKRLEIIDYLNIHINDIYKIFSNGNKSIKINYQSKMTLDKNENKLEYQKQLQKDLFLKQTTMGIHRDDFQVYLHDNLVNNYASQGQLRLIILVIKLSLIDYIYQEKKTYPILLLDDVFSELDNENQNKLLKSINGKVQTLITSTNIELLNTDLPVKYYKVENNEIKEDKRWVTKK